MFTSAYDKGRLHGITQAANNPSPETVILDSMKNNPFKSPTSRKEYIRGVSDGVNKLGRIHTHKQVYGN